MSMGGAAVWSTTAANNATADSAVNWAEGMAPSAVNDSARAMMASFAKWRRDTSGSLTTGGTSTAYTLTTNQSFDSLANLDGQTLRMQFHTTNGASATLNVDGLGAKDLILVSGSAAPASYVLTGGIHDVYYDNGNGKFVLVNSSYQFFQAGTKTVFTQAAAPAGWTKSAALDNAALRIVTGTGGGTGGSANFTSAFASRTIAQGNLPAVTLTVTGSVSTTSNVQGANTLAVAEGGAAVAGAGTNPAGAAYATSAFGPLSFNSAFSSGTTSALGSGTAMDFAVKYLDAIDCTKN